MKSFWGKIGKGLLRFLLRHWAPIAVLVLCALAALSVVQMRQAGMVSALAMLPRLLTYAGLIVAVILVRYVLARWVAGLFVRGKEALRKQVTQQVVEQGKGRASDLWGRGVTAAKGILGGGGAAAGGGWSRATTAGWRRTPTPMATAPVAPAQAVCPQCGRAVRPEATFCDGCGTALKPICPKCGRELRPGADFCDGCGRKIRPRDLRARKRSTGGSHGRNQAA